MILAESPPWVTGFFTAIAILIFFGAKKLFKGKSKDSDLTQNEKRIFNKELNVKNKNDMLERIDYWVDKSDFAEAKKLTDLYIEYNGIDSDIQKRKNFLNK